MCLIDDMWTIGGECTIANICAHDSSITEYKIDFTDSSSLNNWWEKLDLICEPSWTYDAIGSVFFIGWCCTLLWVPLLSDKHTRKKFFVGGMIADFILMSIMWMTTDLKLMILVSFFIGACSSMRINIGYIYMMELMPKKN